jgi:molybdenum cofactor biosynthesis enzyme MoaA
MAKPAEELAMNEGAVMDTEYPQRGAIIRSIGSQPERFEGTEYWNSNIVAFDSKTYVVSHRAILTLVVISSCNAKCKFCSNEITFTPSGPYLKWGPKLERVKSFALTAGVRKVAFTGGEPTLNPQALADLTSAMVPGFTKARLHTNGFGLRREVHTVDGQTSLLDALIAAHMSGVSVSVAHHDPAVNAKIMRFGRAWHGMTDDDHRYVTERAARAFTPRLSCVMTPEGVTTVSDMFDYMEWGRALGYRQFIFRVCSDIPEEYRKRTDYAFYNADSYMSIEPLAAELDRHPGIEKTYTQRKSDSKVDCYRWGDITFDVDESSEEANPDNKIRRLNVMPDGVTYVCWIDPRAVLFEEELPVALDSMKREFNGLDIIAQR